ncbi:unnamed protein product [Prorocentrum cordatum]|uniref:Uncharacterized protein n=1 Tax=Prorocentrum cordatum TaxID=2364126 RepID=A0ABN9SY14_9DINO|nr:unnamed protein product [Polarella glacialis]|mmetsp:Transcript_50000/g.129822  ORF Transcript_50000/g.129822 Transcript_50000/m.129822 type:complete len:106 (+) Transcript_50000:108-425(+)
MAWALGPRAALLLAAAWSVGLATGTGITASSTHFNRAEYEENQIITSLNNCPLCAEHEPCLMSCRKQENKGWGECLDRCLGDNPMLLETFKGMVQSSSSLRGFGS